MSPRFRKYATLMLFAALLAALASHAMADKSQPCTETNLAKDYPRATLPDAVSGAQVALVDLRGPRATVMFCLSLDCPISHEFLPTINAIAQTYGDKGVRFLGINPNGGQSLEQMADYARERKLPFPFLKDAGGKISRQLLYSVTPEARVFDAAGRLVYSGRIDDRYRRGGASDKNVSKDLEQALDEVLAGKPVSASRTRPIGCPLQVAEPR
jgi:peroxiredoxin